MSAGGSTRPDWAPDLDTGVAAEGWRSVWLYDLATDTARQVSPAGVNIWEATWCGPDAFVAICSDAPDEDAWYTADIRHFSLSGGGTRTLFVPEAHLGWLSASPEGTYVAVVEAICSDRTIVAGDLRVIDTATSAVDRPGTCNTDISSTAWRGDHHVLLTGTRGPDSLILLFDLSTNTTQELWCDRETTPSGTRFPEAYPLGASPGDCLFIREGWFERPTLCALRDGHLHEMVNFGTERLHARIAGLGQARALAWQAPDGLEIWGWLLTPPGSGPHPLVLHIHGGPVWYFRQRYLGRDHLHRALLGAGYAVLDVNPRGSSGRGQDYARRVIGDMGGADSRDHLSGIDRLVADGVADPRRLGVTGGSYGGFMSSWLITQDPRFAAAVVLAPITNWVSEQLTAHIARYCEIALAGEIDDPSSQHFTRSPIHHAAKVRTPTLNICGALDKTTPPGQALEFHRALLKHGATSSLLTYPQEGHGIRKMPAALDYLTRLVDWFDKYMPSR
jgi:dipeptidyl aminopeptidase/acylaminoacyl peptidase